ncbi:hypothetical protein C8J56DRAFT_1040710 [Mycena floridula]|nr:hypothetical protein C8J56DRAFT_1040710 [Mycena floridula]
MSKTAVFSLLFLSGDRNLLIMTEARQCNWFLTGNLIAFSVLYGPPSQAWLKPEILPCNLVGFQNNCYIIIRHRLAINIQRNPNFPDAAGRRIPSEIIGDIILYALGFYGSPAQREATTLDTRRGIWVYARICRIWRVVALATAPAWAFLDIRMPIGKSRFHWWSPDILATILSRARSQPLQIRMTLPSANSDIEKQLLKLVVAQSSRWQDVSLDMAAKHFARLGGVKGRLPILESISLTPVLAVVPALRRISLGNFDPTALTIPWHQITQYHIRQQHGFQSGASEALPLLSDLRFLIVELDSTLVLYSPFALPRLQSICIKGNVAHVHYLAAPSLEGLDCTIWFFRSQNLTSMLAQCSLKKLSLNANDSEIRTLEESNFDLRPSLQRVPLLTCLGLSSIGITKFVHLELQDHYPFILPNLQLLVLPLEDGAKDIVKMVRSRWTIPKTLKGLMRPLKELRFVYSGSPLSSEMWANYALFDCFRDEGLLVTLTSHYNPFP